MKVMLFECAKCKREVEPQRHGTMKHRHIHGH
jgi:hypothetical protein